MNQRRLVVLVGLVIAGCGTTEKYPPQLDIPTAHWEPIFFQSIDCVTRKANLPSLRAERLPQGDIELRVWTISLFPPSGEILRREAGEWQGVSVSARRHECRSVRRRTHMPPPEGWASVWKALLEAGLLEIRDDSELEHPPSVFDGTSYVVELSTEGVYRTFMVDNPATLESLDATQMRSIVDLLSQAFGFRRSLDA